MNKLGTGNFNVGFVLALFLFGFLALVFFGGLGKTAEIIGFLYKIPAWIFVVLGIIILFKWMSK